MNDMAMMKKSFFCYFMLLMLAAFSAHAELSANPWADPNTAEDIAEVYGNEQGGNAAQNVPSEVAKTYTKVPERGSSEGFLSKVKNMFNSKGTNDTAAVTPEVSQQQQVLARRRRLSGRKKTAVRKASSWESEEGGFLDSVDMPSGDFSGMMDKVKGFNLKSLTNAFK